MTLANFRSVRRDLLRTKQRIYECDEIGADSQRVGVTSPMPNGHSGGAYTRLEFPMNAMNAHFFNIRIFHIHSVSYSNKFMISIR